jgi:hypothetical protein
MLLTPKLLKRLNARARDAGLGGLLRDLSQELRSDDVPAALRSAANTVADLIDGRGSSGGSSGGAVIINVSVAVAVGAPGKPQGEDDSAPSTEGGGEDGGKQAVVIASAIATAPATPKDSAGGAPPAAGASA